MRPLPRSGAATLVADQGAIGTGAAGPGAIACLT